MNKMFCEIFPFPSITRLVLMFYVLQLHLSSFIEAAAHFFYETIESSPWYEL